MSIWPNASRPTHHRACTGGEHRRVVMRQARDLWGTSSKRSTLDRVSAAVPSFALNNAVPPTTIGNDTDIRGIPPTKVMCGREEVIARDVICWIAP